MLKTFFRIAWRNLRKNRIVSLINILGLSLGISLCLVLITIIKDQLGFDRFHPHAGRTFRINTEAIRKNGGEERYATAPFPVAGYAKDNFPGVEKVVRLTRGLNGDVSYENKHLSLAGFFSDPEFFDVFGFDLLYGDKATALNEPNTIVLTQLTAEKFFGNTDPLGKVLTIGGLDDFKVSGVIKTPGGKTHLEFDMLGSNGALMAYEKQGKLFPGVTDWTNYASSYIYVLLKEKAQQSVLADGLASASKTQYTNLELESRDKGYRFYLQPLNKIVPGPLLSNNMGKAFPSQMLWVIGVFAFIVLISAAFNYNSLSVALSLSRAKEIGIRKATGAFRHQLVSQFLIESVLTTLLAFIIASGIFHFILKPVFEGFSVFREFDVVLAEDLVLYMLFAVFCVIVGLLCGLFPAFYLSSFKPLDALKDLKGKMWMPKLGWRKALLVTQIGAALLFVILLINMYRQMEYVTNADYGFRKDNIINIDLRGNGYEKFRQAFAQNSHVINISGISHSLGTSRDRSIDVRVKPTDDKFPVRDYSIDPNYIDNLGLKLVAGKNFTSDLPAGHELFVMVNESFLQLFRMGSPSEALNKSLILGDSIRVSICGIVKDFHFRPFTYDIGPLVLRYVPDDIAWLNVRVSGIDNAATIGQLEQTWKSLDKTNTFSYRFFADELKESYDEFNDLTFLLGIIASMGVTIASLGFLGIVIFLMRQKVKEISIRKVLGAGVGQLSVFLSRSFIRILIIACVIGLPLSIFIDGFLMQTFAYRVDRLPGYFMGVLILAGIFLLTIGTQIVKAAIANPVTSLRTE